MSKRRQLPPPPLVLQPNLVKLCCQDDRMEDFRKFWSFLAERDLLTDGGRLKWQTSIEGRNGFSSLTGQDVRSYAHGLCLEIFGNSLVCSSAWAEIAQDYFARFDKGKPRRPTFLQRLYLEWSDDLSWPGLVTACQRHPWLWDELAFALDKLQDPMVDKSILNIALACRESMDSFEAHLENNLDIQAELYSLLPRLTAATPSWRLPFLADRAQNKALRLDPTQSKALVKACYLSYPEALVSASDTFARSTLESLYRLVLAQSDFEVELLCCGRGFIGKNSTIELWRQFAEKSALISQINFGARPGKSWLDAWESELRGFIELRSA